MTVNGKEVTVREGTLLKDYLEENGFDLRIIAVGKNGVIVPKSSFATERLSDSDTLEIVRFVGGG